MRKTTSIYLSIPAPGLDAALAEALEKSGRSLESVVRECGISRTFYYNFVKGSAAMDYAVLQKLESALQADFGIKMMGYRVSEEAK
jgi:transcriptional regulator with XRE-family HTH domain